MTKRKRSKSAGTGKQEQTSAKGRKKPLKSSKALELRWISSGDLRLIPDSVLQKTSNRELDNDMFRAVSAAQLNDPLSGAIYGLDENGTIQSALLIHYDPRDRCLYANNMFNADLKNQGLLTALSQQQSAIKATKIKLIHCKPLNIGG